jgi:hypothetical protein
MVGPPADAIEPGMAIQIHGIETEKDGGKISSSTEPVTNTVDQAALDEQVHFDNVKLSFLGIYGFATWIDWVLVAISATCAIIAGALIPVTPVWLIMTSCFDWIHIAGMVD